MKGIKLAGQIANICKRLEKQEELPLTSETPNPKTDFLSIKSEIPDLTQLSQTKFYCNLRSIEKIERWLNKPALGEKRDALARDRFVENASIRIAIQEKDASKIFSKIRGVI